MARPIPVFPEVASTTIGETRTNCVRDPKSESKHPQEPVSHFWCKSSLHPNQSKGTKATSTRPSFTKKERKKATLHSHSHSQTPSQSRTCLTGLELSVFFGPLDDSQCQAVLDGSTGVFALELDKDIDTLPWRHVLQPHDGSSPDGVGDALVDGAAGKALKGFQRRFRFLHDGVARAGAVGGRDGCGVARDCSDGCGPELVQNNKTKRWNDGVAANASEKLVRC